MHAYGGSLLPFSAVDGTICLGAPTSHLGVYVHQRDGPLDASATSILYQECSTPMWLKRIIAQRWERIPERKREKLKVRLWWLCTISAAINISTLILNLESPDHAPYVGALVTVFAFFSFTRLKAAADSHVQDAERKLMEIIAQNFKYESLEIRQKIEAETYYRKMEDYDLEKRFKDLSVRLSGKTSRLSVGYSISNHHHDSPPRPPSSLYQPVVRISNFDDVCSDYRKIISDQRAHSARLSVMETFSILYGAALSAFGADFIKWWNG